MSDAEPLILSANIDEDYEFFSKLPQRRLYITPLVVARLPLSLSIFHFQLHFHFHSMREVILSSDRARKINLCV